jgi:hypothetical protein
LVAPASTKLAVAIAAVITSLTLEKSVSMAREVSTRWVLPETLNHLSRLPPVRLRRRSEELASRGLSRRMNSTLGAIFFHTPTTYRASSRGQPHKDVVETACSAIAEGPIRAQNAGG